VLTRLDDLKSELTLIARYTLAELDSGTDLLRILASEPSRIGSDRPSCGHSGETSS
jgi:hypothetical protein